MDPRQYGPELWPRASQLKRQIARVVERAGSRSTMPQREAERDGSSSSAKRRGAA